MKIVHLSDTHVGYMGQGLQRFVAVPWLPNIPVRQQTADIVAAFTSAIDTHHHYDPARPRHSQRRCLR